MSKYKNILITGKTGTVGSNLEIGTGFKSSECNLINRDSFLNKCKIVNPDAVIHCAAKVGGLKFHLENKYTLFYDNLFINTNVIDVCKELKINRVLSFLSSCIFSDDSIPPYTEKNIHDGFPFPVHYPYGFAKRALEIQSRICYEESGLIYNCIIPTNIYGMNDDFNLETGHVVGVLIHKAFLSATKGVPFEVWGDGEQEREFIFANDISKLTYWALDNYTDKEPLIFCNNQSVKIGYLAHLIAKEFNIENKLIFNTSKPSGQKVRNLSGNKLSSIIDFKFTSIELGIKETIKWFLDNYPYVRK